MEPGRERFESYLTSQGARLGSAIHAVWESRDEAAWKEDPWFFARLGQVADDLGQSMFAHDVLGEGLRAFPGNVRLTQLFSLQLVKCGFLLTARDLLTRLMNEGHFDEETLGILGRVHKEMWLIEGGGAPDHPHLARARELYTGAFRRSRGAYSGINAATLSLIMGDRAASERLARQVIAICAKTWRDPAGRDYWTLATLAEAFLLLGRQEKAARFGRLARARGDRSFSNLASTRRQLTMLSRYTKVDPKVMQAMRIPPVVAFSGHRIDSPGRAPAHFPARTEESVKKQIAAVLERHDVRIGFASAACGGDVLFHECLQERGGQSHVVLPFERGEFFETSVDPAGGTWAARARCVLDRSTSVEEATRGGYGGEDLLFTYANRLLLGKAILRSRFLETEPLFVAVWDGTRSGGTGGTAECVRLWDQTGLPSVIIHPSTGAVEDRAAAPARGAPLPTERRPGKRAGAAGRRVVSILFADMVGFSRLAEDQVPAYATGFLATLARSLERAGARPLYRNIWGDAICFVFPDARAAAQCAIALRDTVRDADWGAKGLPADVTMRIGLHAGPVYEVRDPILGRPNFFGFHMNQAARIEPITRPGNVYASEAFASLLLADRRNELDCRYVGVVVLPKDFGSYPIYHIKRRTEVG